MNKMDKKKEDVLRQNIEAVPNNCNLKNKSLEEAILETYAKYVNKINNSGKIIGAHNGYPIISFDLSFSDILNNYRLYGLYFNKKFSNSFFRMIFTCGGACAIKLNDGITFNGIKYDTIYAIIINRDKFRLIRGAIDFIKAHEFAHIINNNCENDYVWKGDEELIADHYAKHKGFKIKSSLLDMTRWEVNSYHYIETSKNFLWGFIYFLIGCVKHFALNVLRKYNI